MIIGGFFGVAFVLVFTLFNPEINKAVAQTSSSSSGVPQVLDFYTGLGDGIPYNATNGAGDGSAYAGGVDSAGDGATTRGEATKAGGGDGDTQNSTGEWLLNKGGEKLPDLFGDGDCSVYCYAFPLRAIAFPSQTRLAGVRFCSDTVTSFCRERLGLNRSSGNISIIYNEIGDVLNFIESVVKNIQENK